MGKVKEMLGEKNLEEQPCVRRGRPLTNTRQAAMESGLSLSFLYHNWRHIPAARRAGRALRWDVDELLDWMKSKAQAS